MPFAGRSLDRVMLRTVVLLDTDTSRYRRRFHMCAELSNRDSRGVCFSASARWLLTSPHALNRNQRVCSWCSSLKVTCLSTAQVARGRLTNASSNRQLFSGVNMMHHFSHEAW